MNIGFVGVGFMGKHMAINLIKINLIIARFYLDKEN